MKKIFCLSACILIYLLIGMWSRMSQSRPANAKIPAREALQALFPADSRNVFEHSDHLELIAIDSPPGESDNLFDYRIVSRHEIVGARQKAQLIAAFYNGVAEDSLDALCFNPHYAIRATKGRKIVDILVCFDCGGVEVHYGDKRGGWGTSGTPRPAFDQLLKMSKVSRIKWHEQPPVKNTSPGGGLQP